MLALVGTYNVTARIPISHGIFGSTLRAGLHNLYMMRRTKQQVPWIFLQLPAAAGYGWQFGVS